MLNSKIVVLDLGSKLSQSIVRQVRELGVYAELWDYDTPREKLSDPSVKGIIIGDGSTFKVNPQIFELNQPILGVGYGMQLINNHFNEPLKQVTTTLFKHESLEIYGGHPEHLNDNLSHFIFDLCNVKKNWDMATFIDINIKKIQDKVGSEQVICGLSGGVDSSVVAALLQKAIGNQLICIFVDHGLMRKNEGKQVRETFENHFNSHLIYVDARDRFLNRLEGISDPEEKRKIIGNEFIAVFEEETTKLKNAKWLAQGTLYTDVIESGTKTSQTIKSHHNVGGLPEEMNLKLIEPLDTLFKDEVRELGIQLGLPDEMVHRQPFPGPGLGIRIMGEVTKDKIRIVQDSDVILQEEIKKANLHQKIWQYFTVLTTNRTVGISDNKRTYDYTLAIRAVNSVDGMTAEFAHIPYDVLETLSSRIISEVPGVNRVVYDITAKPPGTIEWE